MRSYFLNMSRISWLVSFTKNQLLTRYSSFASITLILDGVLVELVPLFFGVENNFLAWISAVSLSINSSSSLESLLCFVTVTIFLHSGNSLGNGGNGACFLELLFLHTDNNFLVADFGLGLLLTGVDKDCRESACSLHCYFFALLLCRTDSLYLDLSLENHLFLSCSYLALIISVWFNYTFSLFLM